MRDRPGVVPTVALHVARGDHRVDDRFLGRLLGLVFFVPFLVFLFQRRFSWNLAVPLGTLFVLGGLQGLIGWWMVSSGLETLTSVSQYRLATHLGAALLLFLALIWVARRLGPEHPIPPDAQRGPVVLLLVLAAWACQRAVASGRLGWLASSFA